MIPQFFKTIFGEQLAADDLAREIKTFNEKLSLHPEISKKFNELVKLEQQLIQVTERYKSVSAELSRMVDETI